MDIGWCGSVVMLANLHGTGQSSDPHRETDWDTQRRTQKQTYRAFFDPIALDEFWHADGRNEDVGAPVTQ